MCRAECISGEYCPHWSYCLVPKKPKVLFSFKGKVWELKAELRRQRLRIV